MSLNDDYLCPCYSGARRMQSELAAAFDLVADKTNWKNPIDTTVPHNADLGAIADAVIHFTGSIPTIIVQHGNFRIEAAGYYATIGA